MGLYAGERMNCQIVSLTCISFIDGEGPFEMGESMESDADAKRASSASTSMLANKQKR